MSKFALCSIFCAALFSAMLNAQEQRWFEVEMLIFSQTPPTPLQEQFGDAVTPIKPGRAYDLLTPQLQPQISGLLQTLPLCDAQTQHSADGTLTFTIIPMKPLCIIEPQPLPWQQRSLFESRYVNSSLPYPSQLPVVITGKGEHQNRPYLAEAEALQLTDIANKIKRQSSTRLLLHTSWRQAPVTERRAIASRWFAGINYSTQFDYWGQPLAAQPTTNQDALSPLVPSDTASLSTTTTDSTEILSNIELLLNQLSANNQLMTETNSPLAAVNNSDSLTARNLPDQVWQLDGLFKLHLDHYLFVNTEFNLRMPAADAGLQTLYVRQSRRVISGEIHYLDHPYLGIILQIRRYEPPEEKGIDATNGDILLTQ